MAATVSALTLIISRRRPNSLATSLKSSCPGAECVTVEARNLAPKPASLSHREAAAIPMAGLTAVQALFDELCGVVLPFVEGCGDGTEKPVSEDRMREVVTLLARGLKDDAIARRLGVSVRTVRRLISATIDDLQADSRFQAGVVAVQRGWVAGALESPHR